MTVFLAVVLVWAPLEARAGEFLPHRSHLTVPEKVAYFKRSLKHERQVLAWLESRDAPRTLERRSQVGWFRAAVRWHERLLVQYQWKLQPRRPAVDSCLDAILQREGGYNPHAYNASSGAYGGPQALPGSKMASAGADWRDNIWTQIRWMVSYVNGRYGGSCAALDAWNRQGWY